ncbi:ABC transporter permease [Kitasatospora sp. NPDC093806]|uniref:ABC transporter permease n=1 Tax=Kitasatospora sp. NPDC093806 TaxID=3155075 RepID=UPI0034198158
MSTAPTAPTVPPLTPAGSAAADRLGSGASIAVLRTEARLFLREPAVLFWLIAFPSLLLTVLGLIPSLREASEALGGRRGIDVYVPVAVLLSILVAGAQTMPGVLTGYRERGILRRLSTTPASPRSLLTAQIVLHGAGILLSVLLAVAVGRLAFGVALPRQPVGYAVAVVLTVLAGLALGATVSALSRTAKVAQTIGTVIFFPMMFTAGVYAPVQAMPQLLRDIVGLTPLGASAQALDQAASGHWPDWSHLGVTGLWAALLIGAAVRWFRWE